MGFPHLGLLRRLRQLVGHRGRTPLPSHTSLPSFTCWTQVYGGGCRSQSLPLHAASWCTRYGLAAHCPYLCWQRRGYSSPTAEVSHTCTHCWGCTPPISRVGGGDTFSPQTRINRFVFLNLSILSLEVHLGVTASPHTPFPTGYITLPVHSRSLPLRLMPSHSRGQPFTSSILLGMKVFQSCSCPFSYFLLPSGSRHTPRAIPRPHLVRRRGLVGRGLGAALRWLGTAPMHHFVVLAHHAVERRG